MKILFLSVLVVLTFFSIGQAQQGFIFDSGNVTISGGGFTGIFYSNFETTGDRAQWGSLPSGWDNAYATAPAPLFGSYSLYANDGYNTAYVSNNFTADTSGTTYVRLAFRVTAFDGIGGCLIVSLNNGATSEVYAMLYSHNDPADEMYAIKIADSTTDDGIQPVITHTFEDATYWLYITYIRGTSVTAEVKDSTHTLVPGWTITLGTTDSNPINNISIESDGAYFYGVIDNVEIRKDTNWGN